MSLIKRVYAVFCRVELYTVAALLLAITTLVFISAIARTVGMPINWAVDISLLLFAWMVFLGGDVIIREGRLISVDMFLRKFSPRVQKIMMLVFYVMMLAFLVVLVRYGIPLLARNWKRQFQTLPLSYSWCTLAVPAGAFLMFISTSIRAVKLYMTKPGKPGPTDGRQAPALPAAEGEVV